MFSAWGEELNEVVVCQEDPVWINTFESVSVQFWPHTFGHVSSSSASVRAPRSEPIRERQSESANQREPIRERQCVSPCGRSEHEVKSSSSIHSQLLINTLSDFGSMSSALTAIKVWHHRVKRRLHSNLRHSWSDGTLQRKADVHEHATSSRCGVTLCRTDVFVQHVSDSLLWRHHSSANYHQTWKIMCQFNLKRGHNSLLQLWRQTSFTEPNLNDSKSAFSFNHTNQKLDRWFSQNSSETTQLA